MLPIKAERKVSIMNTQNQAMKEWFKEHVIVATPLPFDAPTPKAEEKETVIETTENATEVKKPIASGTIELRKKTKKGKKKGGIKSGLLEVTPEMIAALAKKLEENPPYNGATGRKYTGANVYRILEAGFSDPRWYTWGQVHKLGGRVKKGAKGTKIWGWFYNDESDPAESEDEKPLYKVRPKICTIFNAAQCEGIGQNAPVVKVEETAEEKKPIIRRTIEIKPKTKKTKAAKTETKAANETKVAETAKTAKTPAPVATEKTAETLKACRAALDMLARLNIAAEAWDKKVYDRRFVTTMKEIAKNCTAAEVGFYENFNYSTRKYNGFYMLIQGNSGSRFKQEILNVYKEDFTTTEKGKKPRISAPLFAEKVQEREKYFSEYIKKAEKTVAAGDELKKAVAEIKRLKELLSGYDLHTIETQDICETEGGYRLSL